MANLSSPEPINILIVEDSADDALFVERELRRAGYAPHSRVVCTPHAYRAALSEELWDVIVSDFNMPEFRATEALQILNDQGLDVPFLIVSGTVTDEIAVASMKAGAKDYLIKDNLHRLVPAIERERREARQRRNARTALRDSEANFESLAEALPQIVFTWNRDGVMQYLNQRGTDYTGLSFETIRKDGLSALVHTKDRAAFLSALEEALVSKKALQREVRLRARTGKYRWHLLRVVPVIDAQADSSRWCGTLTDVEELIRMREELKRSNSDLEKFAFVASHDLKEPLRMVNAYAQLLESRYKSLLDKTGLQFLEFLTEGATRMYALIDALLAYSQVSRSSGEFRFIDTNSLVEKALGELAPAVREIGAEITCDKLPAIQGDESQIKMLFQNVLSNAVKFRSSLKPKVRLSATDLGSEIRFSIADNGLGIASEYHEKIFEIFQRLEDRQKYSGTGIGLALCKTIIHRHHGKIWVESEPGRGATFHFTLPSAPLAH